jgi:hypothetical protein
MGIEKHHGKRTQISYIFSLKNASTLESKENYSFCNLLATGAINLFRFLLKINMIIQNIILLMFNIIIV